MIQHLKESTWIKAAGFAIAAIAVLVLWSWLAGCMFMLVNKTKPNGVLPQTFWTYVYHYHAERKVMGQLAISAGVPLVVAFLAVAGLLQKKRSLHGAARFANRREIAQSGLLASKGIIVGTYGNR